MCIETNNGFVVGFSFYSDTVNFTDTITIGTILETDFSGASIWTKKIDGINIDNLIKSGSNFVMVGRMRQLGLTYPFVGSVDSSGSGCYQDQNFVIPTQNTIVAHRNGICFSNIDGPPHASQTPPTTTALSTSQADICQILAVPEHHQTKETGIYPNPFTDRINFGESSYHVFDISGRELVFGHSNGFVDLSFLSDGIYFVQSKNSITKLVKTK